MNERFEFEYDITYYDKKYKVGIQMSFKVEQNIDRLQARVCLISL